MPKTKTKSAPTSAPAAPVQPNFGGAVGDDGNLDLQRFLAAVPGLSALPQPRFDPFSPSQAANPNYRPTPDPNMPQGGQDTLLQLLGIQTPPQPQAGPVMPPLPYDDRQTITQPSLAQTRNTAQQTAAGAQVLPHEDEAAKLQSLAGLYKAQADVLLKHPPTPYSVPDNPQFPTQQFPDIPQREAPTLDPVSGIFGAIGSAIAGPYAGDVSASPFHAAIAHVDQVYADRQRQFQQATQQLSQQYENELAARNDSIRYGKEKASAAFSNAAAGRENDIAAGDAAAKAEQNAGLSETLNGFLTRDRTANLAGVKAAQAQQQINDELGQNAAQLGAAEKQQANEQRLIGNYLLLGSRVHGADTRLQGVQDTNATRGDIADANNAMKITNTNTQANARVGSAKIGAAARIESATIAANQRMQGIQARIQRDSGAGGISPQDKITLQQAGKVWSDLEKGVTSAELTARRGYASQGGSYMLGNIDTYVAQAVAGVKARAEQAKANYEAIQARISAGRKKAPAGKSAPLVFDSSGKRLK